MPRFTSCPARKKFLQNLLFCCFLLSINVTVFPQNASTDSVTVVAGKEYGRGGIYQFFWGKHYRKDWTTPVKVATINLDTVNGGLTAYEKGGGRQSKTLRLHNPDGKEWVMRSIDKSFGKALSDIYRGTFVETVVNDQVSIAEPYSAVTLPGMADAAGIYHTIPRIVFVPKQKALGEFSEDFGDNLYLLEQRPDENWEEAANFGNSKKISGTDKILEKIWADNDNSIDQQLFVRSRLFDMFIGDWGRHEDQWRWAVKEDGDKKIYMPIPRDRDQAYTKFDGALLGFGISAAGADHLQGFGGDIKDVRTYNFPARNLDRQASNEVSKDDWVKIAKELQASLTDAVIEENVRRLPPEVFAISGEQIIANLKSRRTHLVEFAEDYYTFLAQAVNVTGTHEAEVFQTTSIDNGIKVEVFDINKEGEQKKKPFYSREFKNDETKEIRLYGLSGQDRYILDHEGQGILVRVIGGPDSDYYRGKGAAMVYDNNRNNFSELGTAKKHISSNPFVHYYNYESFEYDKKGLGPIISYNSNDHIHVGLKYSIEKQHWRKYPFGQKQEFAARYSITESAFSFGYNGLFKQAIGSFDLALMADYDLVRWNNYYGLGNETKMLSDDRDFHRVRTREVNASIGVQKRFAFYQHISLAAIYNMTDVIFDPGRFHTIYIPKQGVFNPEHFIGAELKYEYNHLDNQAVPTKGIKFLAGSNFLQNIQESDSNVLKVNSEFNFYIPLGKAVVFTNKTGGATLSGKPEFYQYNRLSGAKTMRGYRKYRFYGKSMAYNQTELQIVPNVKTWFFNGRAGVIGFYDIGRVWLPGETSSTWHTGYGGGIMIAPFNKFSIAVFYGKSKNESDYTLRVMKGI